MRHKEIYERYVKHHPELEDSIIITEDDFPRSKFSQHIYNLLKIFFVPVFNFYLFFKRDSHYFSLEYCPLYIIISSTQIIGNADDLSKLSIFMREIGKKYCKTNPVLIYRTEYDFIFSCYINKNKLSPNLLKIITENNKSSQPTKHKAKNGMHHRDHPDYDYI